MGIIKKEFLKFIIALANTTNCQVIAEGIEREAELQLLISLGVKLTQGYLLAKPSPAHLLADLIRRN